MMMNSRLRQARKNAGFKTATAAIERFAFRSSAYRAHENGQNNFHVEDAEVYAKAYGVTAAWLLLGEADNHPRRLAEPAEECRNRSCPENIYALASLLRVDPNNETLISKLEDCLQSHRAKTLAL